MKLLKRLQYRVYNRLYPIHWSLTTLKALPQRPKPARVRHPLNSAMTHSLSDASISLSPSHDLNANDTKSEIDPGEENSFEDLEKFLTQLDWVPSHGGDDTDSDVTFDVTHVAL
ncbi:hypothetical protein M9458_036045, partial [Cirrhinus mrigala]